MEVIEGRLATRRAARVLGLLIKHMGRHVVFGIDEGDFIADMSTGTVRIGLTRTALIVVISANDRAALVRIKALFDGQLIRISKDPALVFDWGMGGVAGVAPPTAYPFLARGVANDAKANI